MLTSAPAGSADTVRFFIAETMHGALTINADYHRQTEQLRSDELDQDVGLLLNLLLVAAHQVAPDPHRTEVSDEGLRGKCAIA